MNHTIVQQFKNIIEDETYEMTILANSSALLMMVMEDVSWVGYYLFNNNELYLAPFQGKVACTKIAIGKGICGTSAQNQATIIVDNVHEFSGHIACDSASNSEIVIPIIVHNQLYGVLDLDSATYSRFNKEDQQTLENCVHILQNKLAEIV